MKDYAELITSLRAKQSRDNRELLDEAADAIEQLIKERGENGTAPKEAKWKRLYSHVFRKMVYQCGHCGCEKIAPTRYCSECGALMSTEDGKND